MPKCKVGNSYSYTKKPKLPRCSKFRKLVNSYIKRRPKECIKAFFQWQTITSQRVISRVKWAVRRCFEMHWSSIRDLTKRSMYIIEAIRNLVNENGHRLLSIINSSYKKEVLYRLISMLNQQHLPFEDSLTLS